MLKDTLAQQFTFTHYVIKANLEGIDHATSLVAPREAGNCLNWVIGHILYSRNGFLPFLGREPIWEEDKSERYRRHADPWTDGSQALELSDLVTDLDRSQEELVTGLETLTAERIAEAAPFSPFGRKEETVGTLFTGLAFHEAYHAGQTGLLRRMAGFAGAIN